MSTAKHIERLIAAFGGQTRLARALGHRHPTTVAGWRRRGAIPRKQIGPVLKAARDNGVPLDLADLVEAD